MCSLSLSAIKPSSRYGENVVADASPISKSAGVPLPACSYSSSWSSESCLSSPTAEVASALSNPGEKRGWVRRLCGSRSVGAPAGGGEDGVVDECHPGIRCVPGRCGPPTCSCDRAPLIFRPGSERPPVNVPAPLPGQHRLVWGGPK